ncbi:M23 family metallopeptidase [bacterium]|nr:M23 family metallopeptidase [bacterium]
MNILKKLKVYITYLTTVSILAVMIIYVAYKNPDLITFLNVDNNYFVESEETINSPFSNTDNVEVVVKTNTQNTQTTNNTPTYVSVNTRTGYAFPTVSGYYISQGYRGTSHDGIDIAGCPYNSNIFAVNDGQVVTVSRKWDNGLYIVIRHDNGYYTMYAHLANAYVSVGQRVSKGQVIGGMGRSGLATGTHLHFSLWNAYPYRGSSLNPFSLY